MKKSALEIITKLESYGYKRLIFLDFRDGQKRNIDKVNLHLRFVFHSVTKLKGVV